MSILQLLLYLILFPLVTALFMLVGRKDFGRKMIVQISAVVIGIGSLLLLFFGFDKGTLIYSIESEPIRQIMFIIELVLAVYLLYLGIRHRKSLTIFLILLQACLFLYFEPSERRRQKDEW